MNHINKILEETDVEIFEAIKSEANRQEDYIELIASENFASKAVLAAQGSIMTNKYAEGYCGKRYYCGCHEVDKCFVSQAIVPLTELEHYHFSLN